MEWKSYKRHSEWMIDDEHDRWKWREFLKMVRIILTETKCKERMKDGC